MATLGSIDLGINTRWENEFDGSGIESKLKWTEGGRLFVFQKPKQKFRKMEFNCGWQLYSTVQNLESLRDAGTVLTLTHNDSRTFSVIIDQIKATPIRATSSHSESKKFSVTLTLLEV